MGCVITSVKAKAGRAEVRSRFILRACTLQNLVESNHGARRSNVSSPRTLAQAAPAFAQPNQSGGRSAGAGQLGNIFLFSLVGLIAARPSPYIGILAYMVAPAFLIAGLLLIGIGVWRERRKKAGEVALYPRIDLNDPAQRSAVLSFGVFLVVFIMLSGAGS